MRKHDMNYFEKMAMTGELDGNTDDGGTGDGGDGADKGNAPTNAELQTRIDALEVEKKKIIANRDDILDEKRKEEAARREADEAALKTAAEKAADSKNFDDYKKSHDALIRQKDEQITKQVAEFTKAQETTEAMRISSRLAEGSNAELLSTFVKSRLRFVDGVMQVLSDSGELTALTVTDLESEFTNSAKYASLLKGRQSSGGGAEGGNGGSAAPKTMLRSDFDQITDPTEKSKVARSGVKIIDT